MQISRAILGQDQKLRLPKFLEEEEKSPEATKQVGLGLSGAGPRLLATLKLLNVLQLHLTASRFTTDGHCFGTCKQISSITQLHGSKFLLQ